MKPVVAIVVAAGSGSRLGGEVPKALRELGGRPLVSHSLERLARGGVDRAVLVVAAEQREAFAEVLATAPLPTSCVQGGAERQDSVLAGLAGIADDPEAATARFVLVHDAARALVPPAVVRRVIEALEAGATAVIPVMPVVDTIRQLEQDGSRVVDRGQLRVVQTPQGFLLDALRAGHALLRSTGQLVTDDAAAVEALGVEVTLVAGDREALKVTEPLDLLFAAAILGSNE